MAKCNEHQKPAHHNGNVKNIMKDSLWYLVHVDTPKTILDLKICLKKIMAGTNPELDDATTVGGQINQNPGG